MKTLRLFQNLVGVEVTRLKLKRDQSFLTSSPTVLKTLPLLLNFALLLAALPLTAPAQTAPQVIPLWEKGAPGFENRRDEPELAASYWVKNVHNPSLTVFLPPKEKATGAAVIVCPGGGFKELGFNGEGVAPAQFLTNLGIAAFALKYRLPRETNSPYSLPKHAREDGQRAMRLVRSHAKEWGIDPNRIGIMGFSAGGEVASMVSYTSGEGDKLRQQIRRGDMVWRW